MPAAPPEIRHLADRLHSVSIHVLRRARHQDALSGLTPARLSALSVIVFAGPLKLGDLADAEQVRPATMSRIVDALVEAALVTKRVDADDARAVQIEATRDGSRVLQAARARRVDTLVEGLEALAPDELRALDRALGALTRSFGFPVREAAPEVEAEDGST